MEGEPRRRLRLPGSLGVLRHRNFRLVATGQFVSSLGTWAQNVGVGWAARELTDSPQTIGITFAAQFLPSLLLAPFGGMLADRFDRRRITIAGNVMMAVPPALLALLVATDRVTLQWLVGLSLASGVASSFTMPASQALVPRLVPVAEVQQAVSLNSALMNTSRLVGAALAGVIIGTLGTAAAFGFNAISFVAVVIAWGLVRIAVPPAPASTEAFWQRLVGGLRYARQVPTIKHLLLLNLAMTFLIMHAPLLPTLVRDVLHSDVSTYALLQMGTGVGAVTGSLLAGQWVTDVRRRRAITAGTVTLAVAVIGISLSRWVPVSVALQVVYGIGFFTTSTINQSMIVLATEDAYRGRVMALHDLTLAGVLPFNALVAGFFAQHIGIEHTVGIAGVVLLAYAFWFTVVRLPSIGIDEPLDDEPVVAAAVAVPLTP